MKKQFRDFESAREFTRSLNLKTDNEWREYRKSGNKPEDIPTNPNSTYKNEYKGMGDWLGTGTVASYNKQFLTFTEAREFVQKLGLKNQKEWNEYCKSGNKPDDIPSRPNKTYKNEFKGFGDFLGTGHAVPKDRVYVSFTKARDFARTLNLKGWVAWRVYCKSGNKPDDIPLLPNKTYKNEFKGMGDFLGTGWCSYESAREFTRKLGLKNLKEWNEYCKSGNKPDDIPSRPSGTYKNEFKGMVDFLGTATHFNKQCRPFTEARDFTMGLNLKGQKEWRIYCKSGNKPDDIPANPDSTYKKDFKGYSDFLGTGNKYLQNLTYRSFESAREFTRSLGLKNWKEWEHYCKSGNKPDDIPSTPWTVYKEWKKK
jgi:hypothetical protein